jgi:hypothetical protein
MTSTGQSTPGDEGGTIQQTAPDPDQRIAIIREMQDDLRAMQRGIVTLVLEGTKHNAEKFPSFEWPPLLSAHGQIEMVCTSLEHCIERSGNYHTPT